MKLFLMLFLFCGSYVFGGEGLTVKLYPSSKDKIDINLDDVSKKTLNEGWTNSFGATNILIDDLRSFKKVATDGFKPFFTNPSRFGTIEVELVVDGNIGNSKKSMIAVQERNQGNISLFSIIRFYETSQGDSQNEQFKFDVLNVTINYIIELGETRYIKFEGYKKKRIKVTMEANYEVKLELISE
jgi:hypothetical protein